MRKNFRPKALASLGMAVIFFISGFATVFAQTEKTVEDVPPVASQVQAEALQEQDAPLPEPEADSETLQVEAREIPFNDDWRFALGDNTAAKNQSFDDSGWRQLTLPHDWSIEFDFNSKSPSTGGGGFLDGGTGWYRKSFTLDKTLATKQISIDFGGVYMDSTVYVNGVYVGNYPYGYTPFSYDITKHMVADGVTQNVVAVRIENKQPSSRWYSGSGIYRNVALTVTGPVHVARYGTFVTTPDLEEGVAAGKTTVNVVTKVNNDTPGVANAVVRSGIYNAKNELVAQTKATESQSVPTKGQAQFVQDITVENPQLWDNENPNLYTLRTEVEQNGQVVDTTTTTFGFRWFTFDENKGFFLNGNWMKLHGVCMHHDQGALGAVANYRAIERQMQTMKEMGVNAIRVVHNPAADELLEICNKLGLLVIDEAFDCWESGKRAYDYGRFFNRPATHPDAKDGTTWAEFDIKQMVERGKNDPSIFMWSLGNEIVGASVGTATKLNKWVKEVDTTRPTTQGYNNFIDGFDPNSTMAKVADVSDVAGFNYGERSYDSAHAAYPKWFIVGAETSSATRSRGIYAHPGVEHVGAGHPDFHQSSYDVDRVPWGRTMQNAYKAYRDREFIAGEFMWTGFDYIGEPTPYTNNWPSKSSYFGAVDTAGFPKDAFYMYQSVWFTMQQKPMVHMVPHWNWEKGEDVILNVYSNAPKVELFLDGKSLGEKSFEQKTTNYGMAYQEATDGNIFLTWKLPFEKGTLRAVAKDENGKEVATDENTTAGQPAAISLTADRSTITADGKDLSYITVDIQDKDGNFVPTANNLVNFSISGNGKIVGVDNGNPIASDENHKAMRRKAFSGKALVIVQSTEDAGAFTLSASSVGLAPSQTTGFTISPADQGEDALLGYDVPKVKTFVGEKPSLPKTVDAIYHLSGRKPVAVEWDQLPEGSTDAPGSFKLNGSVDGGKKTVTLVVQVVGIVGVRESRLTTAVGQIPVLPQTAQLLYTDGSQQAVAVTWERALTAEDVDSEKTFVLKGVGEGTSGEKHPATIAIRVSKGTPGHEIVSRNPSNTGLPKATGSFEQGKDYFYKVNDGAYNHDHRWCNWTGDGGRRKDWIGIELAQEYTVDRMDVYFYLDGSCKVPTTTTVEYWTGAADEDINNDANWAAVTGQDKINAADFSATENQQTIRFNAVKTSKVRVNAVPAEAKCFGFIEIEIFAQTTDFELNLDTDTTLAGINLDGVPMESFEKKNHYYSFELAYADTIPKVEAVLPEGSKASAFVMQAYGKDEAASIEVTAEDGVTKQVYTLYFGQKPLQLASAALSADKLDLIEDDVQPISLLAMLEDGEPLDSRLLKVSYIVDNDSGKIEVKEQKVYAYEAGKASVYAQVEYNGVSVQSNTLEFSIAPNVQEKEVISYENVRVETSIGVKPVLPDKVRANFSEGLARDLEVTWDEILEEEYSRFGTFTVSGTVGEQALRPMATVVVKGVLGAQKFSCVTPLGVAPRLPDRVHIYYSDGTEDDKAVEWEAYDAALLEAEGVFTVPGKVLDVAGHETTPLATSISIRVSADTQSGDNFLGYKNGFKWPVPIASYTNAASGATDSVTHLNDGIVSHSNSPINRWTNWAPAAREEGDWVGIIIGLEQAEKRFIDNLEVDFFQDSGVSHPESYEIQYFVGESIDTPMDSSAAAIPEAHMLNEEANWAEVPNLVKPSQITPNGATNFTFDAVNTFAVRIKMKAPSDKSLGITEIKGFEKQATPHSDFTVENISLDGVPLADFSNDVLKYTLTTLDGKIPEITAKADNNASVSIIQAENSSEPVRIVVTAEDGVSARTYELLVGAAATGVVLDAQTLELTEKETSQLTHSVIPSYALNKTVTWSSNNSAVATVQDGLVTAVGEGKADITVTTQDGNHTAKCSVTVKAIEVQNSYYIVITPVDGATVTVDGGIKQAQEGENVGFAVQLTDKSKQIATVAVRKMDASPLSVTESGANTYNFLMPAGAVAITVLLQDIAPPLPVAIPVGAVSLNKSQETMQVGEKLTIAATVSPENATDKLVNWSSSHAEIASVDAQGVVTALQTGSTEITATTRDGQKTASCKITVASAIPIKAEKVSLNMAEKSLKKGKSIQLKATVSPASATDKTVSWKSSNTKVATVSKEGKVTAKAKGTATITATVGSSKATVKIKVGDTAVSVSGLKLNHENLSLNVKGRYDVKATVKPEKAGNKRVVWVSSDTKVATVNKNGKVTGKGEGTATITATTQESGKVAKCTVVVKAAVKKVTISKTSATLKARKELQLKVTVSPKAAQGTTVVWKSSNPKVATVSTSGRVKAVKAGKASITASVGNKKIICRITVK